MAAAPRARGRSGLAAVGARFEDGGRGLGRAGTDGWRRGQLCQQLRQFGPAAGGGGSRGCGVDAGVRLLLPVPALGGAERGGVPAVEGRCAG